MNVGQQYKDYYAILGVKKDAPAKEIKGAYRRLARKYHPDVNPGDSSAEDKFKDISEAYDVLSDKDKRQKYDLYGDQWKRVSESGYQPGAGGYGGFGPGAYGGFGGPGGSGQRPGQGRAGQSGAQGGPYTYQPGGMPDMDDQGGFHFTGGGLGDLLGSIFGGGATTQERPGRAPRPPRKGQDVTGDVIVSLREAFTGTDRRLTLTLPNGDRKTLTVSIPRGISDGAKLRLAKQGAEAPGGGNPGDLILTVHVSGLPGYERKGDDLYLDLPLTFAEAALGTEKRIPLLAGEPQTLTIPAGVQGGQSLRLRGQGMPVHGQEGKFGDLYVRLKITVPKNLTPEQRQKIEELQESLK